MKVMYVAPRYHPNQIPIVRGWIENGHEVCFLTRLQGTIEDYSLIEPIQVPFSKLSVIFTKLYVKLHPENDIAYDIRLIFGFPEYTAIKKAICGFDPDLVILRDKSIYSIICHLVCRMNKIRAITYNQSPLFVYEEELHRDFVHKIVDKLMPTRRYTPVLTNGHSRDGKLKDPNGFFIPFVADLKCTPTAKKYFHGGHINIIEVGRYEERKNHFLMIDAFEKIYNTFPSVRLTIVGTLDGDFQKTYYDKLKNYIVQRNLSEVVTLLSNLQFNEMHDLYMNSDLYVLPSTNEPAAVSILEAMGYSLPVICSTGNGTSDYVEEGVCGEVFMDNDVQDLESSIIRVISDKNKLVKMGAEAFRICHEKYQFKNYYEALMQAISKD